MYLKDTIELGIMYRKGEKSSVAGYSDIDYARDVNDRKSTSWYDLMFGSGAVS